MYSEYAKTLELVKPIFEHLHFGIPKNQTLLDKILSYYETALQIHPNLEQQLSKHRTAYEIFYQVGMIYQMRTKHPEAIDCFTRAIYLKPTQTNQFISRRDSYLVVNDNQKAAEDALIITCLQKIDLIIDTYKVSQYNVSDGSQRNRHKAYSAFKPIFQSHPHILSHINDKVFLNILGKHFQKEGLHIHAITCFTLIINDDKTIIDGYPLQAIDAFKYRAKSYRRLGDLPAAEQDKSEIQRLIAFKGIDPIEIEYTEKNAQLMKFASCNIEDREEDIGNYCFGHLAETVEEKEEVQHVLADLDDFVLGSGRFGVVTKGHWQKKSVAIKHIKDDDDLISCLLFSHEIEMQRTLSHPNILKLLAFHRNADYNQSHIFIVFEIMKLGSLSKLLLDTTIDVPWSMRLTMAIEITNGLSYLHEQGILHRDIKSQNIMVNEYMQLKIGDFGCAVKPSDLGFFNQTLSNHKAGTPKYWAPEVYESATYSEATDIWALAIVLWEICNRDNPYQTCKNDAELKLQITQGAHDEFSFETPSSMVALILQCWSLESIQRPIAIAVKEELEKIQDYNYTV